MGDAADGKGRALSGPADGGNPGRRNHLADPGRRLYHGSGRDGVELQAVAYISIIHSFPAMIDKLGLDFSKEYEEATNKKQE